MKKCLLWLFMAMLVFSLQGCGGSGNKFTANVNNPVIESDDDNTSGGTYTSDTAGEHAIEITSGTATYENITVTKTGDVSGHDDNYDWKGTNAAMLASGGAVLNITGSSTKITSNAS